MQYFLLTTIHNLMNMCDVRNPIKLVYLTELARHTWSLLYNSGPLHTQWRRAIILMENFASCWPRASVYCAPKRSQAIFLSILGQLCSKFEKGLFMDCTVLLWPMNSLVLFFLHCSISWCVQYSWTWQASGQIHLSTPAVKNLLSAYLLNKFYAAELIFQCSITFIYIILQGNWEL